MSSEGPKQPHSNKILVCMSQHGICCTSSIKMKINTNTVNIIIILIVINFISSIVIINIIFIIQKFLSVFLNSVRSFFRVLFCVKGFRMCVEDYSVACSTSGIYISLSITCKMISLSFLSVRKCRFRLWSLFSKGVFVQVYNKLVIKLASRSKIFNLCLLAV